MKLRRNNAKVKDEEKSYRLTNRSRPTVGAAFWECGRAFYIKKKKLFRIEI